MPERVNPNKAESQMTLASARSVSDEKQPGWLGRRTRLERYLILAATTVLFVVVGLSISLAAVIYGYQSGIFSQGEAFTSCSGAQNVCRTKGCVMASASLIESMDETVDPCQDFFKFACGGFLKKKIIPDDKTTISRFNEISDELQEKLRGLVEAEETPKNPASPRWSRTCTSHAWILRVSQRRAWHR